MFDAISDLRAGWSRGETTTNCWLTIPHPFIAEVASRSGFDSLCIDMQHGLVDLDAVTGMLQATTAARKPTLVRVPWNEPSVIMRVLDMGAAGVVVPLVESAEERSEEHTSELQSRPHLVCRLLLEKKNKTY